MKTWFILFGLWVVSCLGVYVWLRPLKVSHEAPFKPVMIEEASVQKPKLEEGKSASVKKSKKKRKPLKPAEIEAPEMIESAELRPESLPLKEEASE